MMEAEKQLKVSVIMPAYNSEKYIERSIKSVLSQTHSALELIVVDDGSTDRTPAILRRLASGDSRLRVVRTENHGPALARNVALEQVSEDADFVTFIDADDELLPEMGKDIKRLQRIAERFSKIGSQPEPKPENLNEVLSNVMQYIGRRTSNHVTMSCNLPAEPLIAPISAPLFEWVIENLCKNAIDAMEGKGSITLTAKEEPDCFSVEVADTGKGIPKNRFGSVFMPGYTTKERGWGLGLSLAKRIVEEYHNGRIFVKNSELGKGTTFRVELKKH